MRRDNVFFFVEEALLSSLLRRLVDVCNKFLNFRTTGLE